MAAAAAALSRSSGVAGVRTTKGLFFILTLLCLVCLTCSQKDKDQQKMFMEFLQKAEEIQRLQGKLNEFFRREQQDPNTMKATMVTIAQLMGDSISLIDLAIAVIKKPLEEIPDFPPLDEFLENVKDFMENIKTYAEKKVADTEKIAEKDEL